MTLKQLEELDALADNATQGEWDTFTENYEAWVSSPEYRYLVQCFPNGEENSAYIAAACPTTVKQLIKALRKMADGYSRSWYAERAARWDEGPEPEELAAKAAELMAKALED